MKKKPLPKKKEAWKIRLDKEWKDFVRTCRDDVARSARRVSK